LFFEHDHEHDENDCGGVGVNDDEEEKGLFNAFSRSPLLLLLFSVFLSLTL
jgi:hypothetical protein